MVATGPAGSCDAEGAGVGMARAGDTGPTRRLGPQWFDSRDHTSLGVAPSGGGPVSPRTWQCRAGPGEFDASGAYFRRTLSRRRSASDLLPILQRYKSDPLATSVAARRVSCPATSRYESASLLSCSVLYRNCTDGSGVQFSVAPPKEKGCPLTKCNMGTPNNHNSTHFVAIGRPLPAWTASLATEKRSVPAWRLKVYQPQTKVKEADVYTRV